MTNVGVWQPTPKAIEQNLRQQIVKLEAEFDGLLASYNERIDEISREGWTDPITRAMRVVCDHVGRWPERGDSGISDYTRPELKIFDARVKAGLPGFRDFNNQADEDFAFEQMVKRGRQ